MEVEIASDLLKLHASVLEHVRELGLSHFPGTLALDGKRAVLTFWEDDADWQQFLSLARDMDAKVVYTNLAFLSEDDVAEEPDDPRPQTIAVSGHLGEPFELSVAYVSGIVVHLWVYEADWWQVALASGELDQEELANRCKLAVATLAEGRWVEKIASDPRFYGAKRKGDQWSLGRLIIRESLGPDGDLFDVPQTPVLRPLYQAYSGLIYQASEQVDLVRTKVADRALEHVPEMVAQIAKEFPDAAAASYRLREQKAKRLVMERYGMNFPVVTSEIARRLADSEA